MSHAKENMNRRKTQTRRLRVGYTRSVIMKKELYISLRIHVQFCVEELTTYQPAKAFTVLW